MNNCFEELIKNIICSYKEFAIFETLKVDSENFLSYVFISPKEKLSLTNPSNIEKFFNNLETYLKEGYYLAGFFSYELGYFLDYYGEKPKNIDFPLAFFYVFEKPIVFNHKKDVFEDEDFVRKILDKFCNLDKIKSKLVIKNANLNVDYTEYEKAVEKLKNYILEGDTYQVNYTIKLKFDLSGSIFSLYEKLKQTQKVSYSAFIKTKDFSIISFSPELFFRKKEEKIVVRPMKGTIDRGRTLYEDKVQQKKLKTSTKNRAENVMIVDLLRNDLGKISSYGDVKVKKLFEVEKYETLFQMTSTIEARIDKDINLYKLFYAIFPSGSVTGAPKIRTMQIIKEVEKEQRKIYTGSVGFFMPNKDAVFNVAIRTILVNKNGKAEMGIGSGIVADSVSKKEFEECKLKSMFLFKTNPKFRLVETMLYCSNFSKKIEHFDGLKLNIDKEKFQYGFFLLDYHLNRLKESAIYFGFVYNEQEILKKLLSLKLNGSYKVRLLLSKNGKFEIETYRFDFDEFCSKEIKKIALSKIKVDENNIFLYHKTTYRNLYNKVYNDFKRKGFFDVLFVNKNGEITEASRGNIFVKIDKTFYTPKVSCGLLNGIFRKYLIENNKEVIKEEKITLEKLKKAKKIYFTNAVVGIREVVLENI